MMNGNNNEVVRELVGIIRENKINQLSFKFMPSGNDIIGDPADTYMQVLIDDRNGTLFDNRSEKVLFNIPIECNSPEASNTIDEFKEWNSKYSGYSRLIRHVDDFVISDLYDKCTSSLKLGEIQYQDCNTTFELHVSTIRNMDKSHGNVCIHAVKETSKGIKYTSKIFRLCHAWNIILAISTYTNLNRDQFKSTLFEIFKGEASRYIKTFVDNINNVELDSIDVFDSRDEKMYGRVLDSIVDMNIELSKDDGSSLNLYEICQLIKVLLTTENYWINIEGVYEDKVLYSSHIDIRECTEPSKLFAFNINDVLECDNITKLAGIINDIKDKLNIKGVM